MDNPSQQLRFVERPAPRAKPIPKAKWDEYKEELCSMYMDMTLEELMDYMKNEHGFEPSHRQYIYQFEKWNVKKYNTLGRGPPETYTQAISPSRDELSISAPPTAAPNPFRPPVPPKRSKSLGSLQSRSSRTSSERPTVPPKKRQKLAEYIDARSTPTDYGTTHSPSSTRPPANYHESPTVADPSSAMEASFLPHSQPNPSGQTAWTSGLRHVDKPVLELNTSNAYSPANAVFPEQVGDDDAWLGLENSDETTRLLNDEIGEPSVVSGYRPPGSRRLRRRFDSSRPVHTFSQEELVDLRMAAHFLRALGFDSDAFELFTILLKYAKESDSPPFWQKSLALITSARSAVCSSQVEIARNEIFKTLEGPRESSTDVEHFLYRMLLAETYTRSDDKENEDFLSEIAIGCELASDRVLDHLPDDHRSYDILTYHYLNKCLEYLNSFVKDAWDNSPVFTDKNHLQIRILERVPGPFELRHGSMRNLCLRNCIEWCTKALLSGFRMAKGWSEIQTNDRDHMYWTDHIGLYCALWERWQSQRRDCLGVALDPWMTDAESRMGIHSAELLSITCGIIMGAAPSRRQAGSNLKDRACKGVRALCQLSDKDLGCQFLETYSLLSTLLGSAPRRQYHDLVSFFATLVNSTREHEAFSNIARSFVRDFIEEDLDISLPDVQVEAEPPPLRRDSNRLSLFLSQNARLSMESLAAATFPTLTLSRHSSELSAMRSLRDRIQEAHRRSLDNTGAPSNVYRLASQSFASIPTVDELSQALRSSLSLSSLQQRRNAALDTIAAAPRDFFDFLTQMDGDPFSDRFGEVDE